MYWSFRKRLQSFSFQILKTRHSLGARAHSVGESAQIFFSIMRSIGGSFLAVLIVVAAAIVDFGFRRFIASTETFASHWQILSVVYAWLKQLHFKGDAASALLGTLAQIAGYFSGLYFAVVGSW